MAGIWPAIWMLPTAEKYGAWAASGEIDIAEVIGHEWHAGAWRGDLHHECTRNYAPADDKKY